MTSPSHEYPADPDGQAVRRVADAFHPDATYEAWMTWRTTDAERYAQIPASARLALGHYETTRQAALDAGTAAERLTLTRELAALADGTDTPRSAA